MLKNGKALYGGICTALLLSCPLVAHGHEFAGGTGEMDAPYQIATIRQLASIGTDPNLLDRCFVLTDDIDLDPNLPGGCVFTHAVIASDADDANAAFQGAAFSGDFDGRANVIRNLTIKAESSHYLALFGLLAPGASVRSVRFENARIEGGPDAEALGALAGSNHGSVANCRATAAVSGGEYLGGLIGYNAGAMVDCHAIAEIMSHHHMHGRGGGLVGRNAGMLASSSAEAKVFGNGVLGGLSGANSGVIWRCFATGDVAGGDYIGGLVGSVVDGLISDCYALASVRGTCGVNTGGLIGYYAGGTVVRCYAAGAVHTGEEEEEWDWGGFIGWDAGLTPAVTDCFWDIETSGKTVSNGGTGRTTAEMQMGNTFIEAGWDFWSTWMICEGTDYPHLQWEGVFCED